MQRQDATAIMQPRRMPLRDLLYLRRAKSLPDSFPEVAADGQALDVSASACVSRIRQTICTSDGSDEMLSALSLFDALTQLHRCLARSCSLQLFCQLDEIFFKALACSLLGRDPDPLTQTATADLARDLCAVLFRALQKSSKPFGIHRYAPFLDFKNLTLRWDVRSVQILAKCRLLPGGV
uniref:Uncharacterized protein n=2 Tax=Schistocephalus solidus TaxID=70667 RepID=A0A0V0JC46_SCHSO